MNNEVLGNYKEFILGGKAEFTIFQEPNIQVKYRVYANDNKTCWFVYTEPNDSKDTVYQGYLKRDLSFNVGARGMQNYNQVAVNALLWVLKHKGNMPDKVHIYHHGKCSVCGRKLKDAESLKYGIGPTCRSRRVL